MSTRQPRFEIVRSDAGWFARVRGSNGIKVWQSEVYTRRRAAVNACRVLGDLFSPVGRPAIVERFGGREYLVVPLDVDTFGAKAAYPLTDRDEREVTE